MFIHFGYCAVQAAYAHSGAISIDDHHSAVPVNLAVHTAVTARTMFIDVVSRHNRRNRDTDQSQSNDTDNTIFQFHE
jgi:hypothetical protein